MVGCSGQTCQQIYGRDSDSFQDFERALAVQAQSGDQRHVRVVHPGADPRPTWGLCFACVQFSWLDMSVLILLQLTAL